ncbi:MAG TPA: mechanosensitive ion channel domain-containing protein [Myxococcales bacterium]|nr:mechanosensitive ion channel domain-containing protein [Myxococcales bacterium]
MIEAMLAVAVAATSPAPAPPAPIPGAQLVRAAETAYAELQRTADLAGPDGRLDALVASLGNVEREINQLRSAVSAARTAVFDAEAADYLGREVARKQALVSQWDDELSARVQLLDAAQTSLRRQSETWRLTVESLGSDVPPSLMARAADVRDRVAQAEIAVRQHLATTLELQDRVAAVKLSLSVLVATLASADASRKEELLAIESTQLWRPAAWSRSAGSPGVLRILSIKARAAVSYVAAEPVPWAIHLIVAVTLIAIGLAVTGRLRSRPPAVARPLPVEVVTRYPVDSAVLMAVFATPLIHPARPPALSLLMTFAGLLPVVRIAGVLAPAWRRPVRWLATLFAAERLIAFAPLAEPSARAALLALTMVAAVVFAIGMRPGSWLRRLDAGRWKFPLLAAAAVAALLFAAAAVANVVGNVTLAEFLTDATLASIFGGIALAAVVAAAAGAFRALLEFPSSRQFRVVRNHEEMLVRRGRVLLRAAGVVVWLALMLRAFEVTQSFRDVAAAVLGLRLKVGGLDLAVGDAVAFVATLWISVWLARALKFVLDEAILPPLDLKRGSADAISTSAKYAVVGIGFGAAVLAAGVEITRFTLLAGTLGVGIGFGLQNVVNNFVSGLILLYEQPVQVGDVVEVGTLTGEIRRIGVRSSTVRTFQGADVIVPNSNFISAEVVNWTGSDRWRRVDITLSVAYGTNPNRVVELLLGIAKSSPGVASTPEPLALFTGFGESALQFELRVWAKVDDWIATASALRTSINEILRQSGIVLAFPQLDLWVRSVPEVMAKRQLLSGAGQLPAVSQVEAERPRRVEETALGVPQPFGGFRSSREPKK